jgi:hypothetical protein
VKIGGVGGVKTRPQARGQGYASAALRCAALALRDNHQVAFSLLVCQAHLLPFYQKLGWLPFAGRLVVEQRGGSIEFTVNRVMVLPGLQPAPQHGLIDLAACPGELISRAANRRQASGCAPIRWTRQRHIQVIAPWLGQKPR